MANLVPFGLSQWLFFLLNNYLVRIGVSFAGKKTKNNKLKEAKMDH